MTSRTVLLCLSLPLGLLGCRPQQSELDEINRKLDDLAMAQERLVDNLDDAWARERQGTREPDSASGNAAAVHQQLSELKMQHEQIQGRLEDVEEAVEAEFRPWPTPAAKPRVAVGRPDPAQRYRVDIGKSHVLGPRGALVTVVMITDYQCPFSKRVQPTLAALRTAYPKTVRFVHKHNPLPMHNRAMPAALAAEAAGRQGKFWKMHELLWQDPRALTNENFSKYAAQLNLDGRKFQRDLQAPELVKRIKAEQVQGSQVGARGTPAFFINGRFLSGAQPKQAFEKLIDEELAVAKAMVKKGTPRSGVYKALMKTAKTKP